LFLEEREKRIGSGCRAVWGDVGQVEGGLLMGGWLWDELEEGTMSWNNLLRDEQPKQNPIEEDQAGYPGELGIGWRS
jgi:hypothetical protein